MRPPSGYVATLVSRHPASEQHPRRKWFCTLAPVEAGSALWRLSRLDSGTVLPHHCDAVLVKCMAASESLAAPTPERVPDEIFLGNALSSAEDACHCHSRSTANIMWLPRRRGCTAGRTWRKLCCTWAPLSPFLYLFLQPPSSSFIIFWYPSSSCVLMLSEPWTGPSLQQRTTKTRPASSSCQRTLESRAHAACISGESLETSSLELEDVSVMKLLILV